MLVCGSQFGCLEFLVEQGVGEFFEGLLQVVAVRVVVVAVSALFVRRQSGAGGHRAAVPEKKKVIKGTDC